MYVIHKTVNVQGIYLTYFVTEANAFLILERYCNVFFGFFHIDISCNLTSAI